MDFIFDESMSMRARDGHNNKGQLCSRVEEAKDRVLMMIGLAGFAEPRSITIRPLNGTPEIIHCAEKTPENIFNEAQQCLSRISVRDGNYTPLNRNYNDAMRAQRQNGNTRPIYVVCDGDPYTPSDSNETSRNLERSIKSRRSADKTPLVLIAVTDEDNGLDWMNRTDKDAPYCNTVDDFDGEAKEVRDTQGEAFPYSKGLYLMAELLGGFSKAVGNKRLSARDMTPPIPANRNSAKEVLKHAGTLYDLFDEQRIPREVLSGMMGYNVSPETYNEMDYARRHHGRGAANQSGYQANRSVDNVTAKFSNLFSAGRR